MFTTRNRRMWWFHQRSKRVRMGTRIMFPTDSETVLFYSGAFVCLVFFFRRLCKMSPRARIWIFRDCSFRTFVVASSSASFAMFNFTSTPKRHFYSLTMRTPRRVLPLEERSIVSCIFYDVNISRVLARHD